MAEMNNKITIKRKNHEKIIDIWNISEIEKMEPEATFYNRIPIYFKKNDNVKIDAPEGWDPIIERYGDVSAIYGFKRRER